MDVSGMPLAVLSSDEGDGVALYVFPMGNGDWYACVAPEREDGGLPMSDQSVRFCTDGSQLGDSVLVMAILYRVATGDREQALDGARALVDVLSGKPPGLPLSEGAEACRRCGSLDRLTLCDSCGEDL